MNIMSAQRFKRLAKSGERPRDAVLRKQFTSQVSSVGDRRLSFVISTAAVDRENDTIALAGWDLTAYRANPVVLWAHSQCDLPVGKAVEIEVTETALRATVEFVPAEVPIAGPMAEAVLQLCSAGFLSATSVGFRPLEYDVASARDESDGWYAPYDFVRQELLEFSVVTVPCNPEALLEVADDLPDAAVQAVDSADPELARAAAAALIRAARIRHRHRLALATAD